MKAECEEIAKLSSGNIYV